LLVNVRRVGAGRVQAEFKGLGAAAAGGVCRLPRVLAGQSAALESGAVGATDRGLAGVTKTHFVQVTGCFLQITVGHPGTCHYLNTFSVVICGVY
jgi:hypothetical protein